MEEFFKQALSLMERLVEAVETFVDDCQYNYAGGEWELVDEDESAPSEGTE